MGIVPAVVIVDMQRLQTVSSARIMLAAPSPEPRISACPISRQATKKSSFTTSRCSLKLAEVAHAAKED